MDKNLLKRLIALVLTGGVMLSSTGVYTAIAATEDPYSSEYTSALVGSNDVVMETIVEDVVNTTPIATETTVVQDELTQPTTKPHKEGEKYESI